MLYHRLSIFNSIQKTISNEEIALISYVIFFVIIVMVVFISFFIAFQKRKNQLLQDKIKQQQQFDEELVKTQQEIQEETLKHVGRELHDNIGQMLVMSTMQMNAALKLADETLRPKVKNASDTLKGTLEEVRALSKSLNNDIITNLGFEATVRNEIHRLNKSGLIKASLSVDGDVVNFENKKDEVILFRILQEFFSNTLKYAEAEKLCINITYEQDKLIVEVTDNGIGFDLKHSERGSGLINMEKRAELIDAEFQIKSKNEAGTRLRLVYPFKKS